MSTLITTPDMMTRQDDMVLTVTVGTLHSDQEGDIILVYVNEGEDDAMVLRFDRLSRRARHLIESMAQDPLHVLSQPPTHGQAAHPTG